MAESGDDFVVFRQLVYGNAGVSSGLNFPTEQLQRVSALTHEMSLLLDISRAQVVEMPAEAFEPLFLCCYACGFTTARDLAQATAVCAACGVGVELPGISGLLEKVEELTTLEKLQMIAAEGRQRGMQQPMRAAGVLLKGGGVALEAVLVNDAATNEFVVEQTTRDAVGRPGL